jgi:hypothetical protein
MRTNGPVVSPSDPLKRRENAPRFSRRPVAHTETANTGFAASAGNVPR